MRTKEEKELEEILNEMYDDAGDSDSPVTDQSQISTWLMNSIGQKVEVYHGYGNRTGFLTLDRGIFIVSDSKKAGTYPKTGYVRFTTNNIEDMDEANGALRISLK